MFFVEMLVHCRVRCQAKVILCSMCLQMHELLSRKPLSTKGPLVIKTSTQGVCTVKDFVASIGDRDKLPERSYKSQCREVALKPLCEVFAGFFLWGNVPFVHHNLAVSCVIKNRLFFKHDLFLFYICFWRRGILVQSPASLCLVLTSFCLFFMSLTALALLLSLLTASDTVALSFRWLWI